MTLDETESRVVSVFSPLVVAEAPNFDGQLFRRINFDMAYLHTDLQDNTWMGAVDGIFNFDTQLRELVLRYKTSSWAIAESNSGELFFGTSQGMLYYNPFTKESVSYSPNEEKCLFPAW